MEVRAEGRFRGRALGRRESGFVVGAVTESSFRWSVLTAMESGMAGQRKYPSRSSLHNTNLYIINVINLAKLHVDIIYEMGY